MENMKKLMVQFPTREHFDPTLPNILETDAARKKGLDYCPVQLHDNGYKMVEAGSHWLTPAQTNCGMT